MSRIFTVAFILAVTAVCFRLGLWQLERHGERKRENAAVVARSTLPRAEITGLPSQDILPYRSVVARGIFDLGRQIVRVGRPMDGIPGVVVVTPLVLEDGSAVLVERGWAPSPDARRVVLDRLDEPRHATVNGIVVPAGKTEHSLSEDWPVYVRSIDTEAVARKLGSPVLPWVLRRTDPPPVAETDVFRAVRPPVLSNGPHLSYALQWFSFGIIALVGGYFLVFRHPNVRPPVGRGPNGPQAEPSRD